MTQCSFIGSVAFALRCARRSRFTTLSRIFPPSLSAVVPSLLFTRFPFSSIVLFISTLVSSFPSTFLSVQRAPMGRLPGKSPGYSLLIISKKYRLSLFLLFFAFFEKFCQNLKGYEIFVFELIFDLWKKCYINELLKY